VLLFVARLVHKDVDMSPSRLFFLGIPVTVIVAAHCGGTVSHTQGFPEQHVAVAPTCPTTRPPSIVDAGPPPGDGGVVIPGCHSDSDCTMGKNGRCMRIGNIAGDTCTYDECFTDGDCGQGKACLCSADGNLCLDANCQTDGDCAGLGCSPSYGTSCGPYSGTQGFYCHTPSDECVDDKDCNAGGKVGYCAYSSQAGHWACAYSICSG